MRVDADAEPVMFSPQHEHSHVIDHMIRKGDVTGEGAMLDFYFESLASR